MNPIIYGLIVLAGIVFLYFLIYKIFPELGTKNYMHVEL